MALVGKPILFGNLREGKLWVIDDCPLSSADSHFHMPLMRRHTGRRREGTRESQRCNANSGCKCLQHQGTSQVCIDVLDRFGEFVSSEFSTSRSLPEILVL